MRKVQRSALVPYPAEEMFALVDEVEAYPRFLPWCRNARVESRQGEVLRASLELSRGGLHKWFTTENRREPGRRIDIRLVEGPFRRLEGHWRFEPLGAEGSKVSLDMEFEFASRMLDVMFGPVFHQICNSLLEAFVREAHARHGR